MNNEKDAHPLINIVVHHLPTFSPKVDGLIYEISRYATFYNLEQMYDWFAPPPLDQFEQELEEIRTSLIQREKEKMKMQRENLKMKAEKAWEMTDEQRLEEAKKIYFDYSCHHYFMQHNDVLDFYNKFGVSDGQEKAWRREYISNWVQKLSVDDLAALHCLRNAQAIEAIPELIAIADKGDSYSKLEYARILWELSGSKNVYVSDDVRQQAVKTSVKILKFLTKNPIELSSRNRKHISRYVKASGASTPEDYVAKYAERTLAEMVSKRIKVAADSEI